MLLHRQLNAKGKVCFPMTGWWFLVPVSPRDRCTAEPMPSPDARLFRRRTGGVIGVRGQWKATYLLGNPIKRMWCIVRAAVEKAVDTSPSKHAINPFPAKSAAQSQTPVNCISGCLACPGMGVVALPRHILRDATVAFKTTLNSIPLSQASSKVTKVHS